MIALELVLYGVRHFLDIKKLTFRPGLNLIHGGNGAGKTTIADTFFEMLVLDKDRPVIQSLAPIGGKELCQAALIFESKDGGIYRLVRDFLKGNGSLSKLDQEKKFALLSKDKEHIIDFIHSETQKLSADQLKDGLFFSRAVMPSSRSISQAGFKSMEENRSKTSGQSSSMSKAKRLEEIKASLASADRIVKFEEQLDKVQSRLLEIKRQQQRYEEQSDELKRLIQEQAAYQGFQDLPKNVPGLIDDYKTSEKTLAQDVRELDEQKLYIEDQLSFIPATPIFLSKLFLLGIGVMVVSLLLAFFLHLEGFWQTLYLLGLLTGAVLVAASVLLDVRRLSHRNSIEAKLANLTHERETLETKFKKQNAAVTDLLKKTSCQNVDELRDKCRSYMEMARAGQNLREEQSRLFGGKKPADLNSEQQALVVSAKELESKIKEAQGSSSDIYTLQEEMRMIQREMAEEQASKPKESSRPEQTINQVTAEKKDSSLRLKQFETVPKKQLETHATEWLRRLSRGRYDRLEYDDRSNITVFDRQGSPTAFDNLSSGMQDRIYLSILWAGLQLTNSGISALPVVLDDPFAGLDDSGRQVAVETLKELGRHRQILLLTTASHPNKDNLHYIELD
jgi:DNA repair exonuclease SbcCD ATPase subunit